MRASGLLRTAPLLLVGLTGCAPSDSVLAPQGPDAAGIAQLALLLFVMGTAVMTLVLLALWLAIRGSARTRARLASDRLVVAGGIVFPAVTLTALLAYGTAMLAESLSANGGERIEVIGEQWWWRISYAAPDGARFVSANEIHIPAGRRVEFSLKSADVIHSFWVPSLGGKVDMIPGRTTSLRVTASRPGVFRGQCAEYCGGPHALMTLRIVAMTETDYEAWRAREAAPASEPVTEPERRGRTLFLAAGCGACHAIRGTQADGTIGPDLTHLGARRSVGVETLAMTRAGLAQFIANGQHVKPGNTMPHFRVFSNEDRDALTAYLVSLR